MIDDLADALEQRGLRGAEAHHSAADVLDIDRARPGAAEKSAERLRQFTRKLLTDLRAIEKMLDSGAIESGVRRIGAEQELFLVNKRWGASSNNLDADLPAWVREGGHDKMVARLLDPPTRARARKEPRRVPRRDEDGREVGASRALS